MAVGDEIIGLDSLKFTYYDEFQNYLAENKSKTVILNILRDKEKLNIPVVTSAAGLLGVMSNRSYDQFLT